MRRLEPQQTRIASMKKLSRTVSGLALLLATALLPMTGIAQIEQALPTRIRANVDQVITQEFSNQELVGLAVGVVRNGKIVHLRGRGFEDLTRRKRVTTSTMFRWASISKSVTGVAAMQLAERGHLDLREDIQKYIRFPNKGHKITTHQLLANHAGFAHYKEITKSYPAWMPRSVAYPANRRWNASRALEVFQAAPLVKVPGSDYHYSTFGFIVAGAVLDSVGRRTERMGYEDLVMKNIAEPLGMTSFQPDYTFRHIPNKAVGYTVEENSNIVIPAPDQALDITWKLPGGGFVSTITDLTRFGKGLVNGSLVSPASSARMWRRHRTDEGDAEGYGYGFFVSRSTPKRVSHSGGQPGIRTLLVLYPRKKAAVAIMTNCTWTDSNKLANRVLNALEIDDLSFSDAPTPPRSGPRSLLSKAERQARRAAENAKSGAQRTARSARNVARKTARSTRRAVEGARDSVNKAAQKAGKSGERAATKAKTTVKNATESAKKAAKKAKKAAEEAARKATGGIFGG